MLIAARSTLRISALIVGMLLILLALLLATARIGLPMVAGYKADIEYRLAAMLDRPVSIGDLKFQWSDFGPRLQALDVTVSDTDDRSLQLDALLIDINLATSIWRRTPIIEELTVVGANLIVEYAGDGEFAVHGIANAPSSDEVAVSDVSLGDGINAANWLLNAERVAVLDTNVTLVGLHNERTLRIDSLDIRAENTDAQHLLRIEMQLPPELGGALEIGLDLEENVTSLKRTTGDLYLAGDGLYLDAWSVLMPDLPLTTRIATALPVRGEVDLRLWGRWQQGDIQSGRMQIEATNVTSLRHGKVLLDELGADMTLSRSGTLYQVEADKLYWQRGDAYAELDKLLLSESATAFSIAAAGEVLSLDTLVGWPASGDLPIAAIDALQQLEKLSPAGTLRRWQVAATLPIKTESEEQSEASAPALAFNFTGELDDVSWQASSTLPAVTGLNAIVSITPETSRLAIDSDVMSINWPGVLDETLLLAVDSQIDIETASGDAPKVSGRFNVSDGNLDASSLFAVTLQGKQETHVDVQGRFSLADVGSTTRYLPMQRVPRSAAVWLRRALVGGQADNGRFVIFGKLGDLPFDTDQGVLQASFDVREGHLDYWRGWPAATNLAGRLDFDRLSMSGTVSSGRLDGVKLSNARFGIPDFRKAELQLQSTGAGQLADMLNFANTGPLKRFLSPALGDAIGTGGAEMDLSLALPLRRQVVAQQKQRVPAGLSIEGAVFLKDNTLRFDNADIDLTSIKGAVNFNERGVRIGSLRADWLGNNIGITGETVEGAEGYATRLNFQSAIDAGSVLAQYGIPLVEQIRGQSIWDVELVAPHDPAINQRDGIALTLRSDLVGTQVSMPAPLNKASAAERGITLQTSLRQGAAESRWKILLEPGLQAEVLLDAERLIALQATLGDTPLATGWRNGFRVAGKATVVDIPGWIESLVAIDDELAAGEEPQPFPPIVVDIQTPSLAVGPTSLGSATLRANTDENFLNVLVSNQHVRGNVRYPRKHWSKTEALRARVAYVDKSFIKAFDDLPDVAVDGEPERWLDPQLLPPIEAHISEFRWDRLNLQNVVLRARPDIAGIEVQTLGFATRTTQMIGSGYWHVQDPQGVNPELAGAHRSRLSLRVQSGDFGVGLAEVGFTNTVDAGEGEIALELDWPGPLYLPEIAQMEGSLTLDLQRGRILALDPGAGRLVGLFAIQTLPRRLSLDFNDITRDGLDFRRLRGDIVLSKGIADTRLVQLSGPVGVIDLTGKTNLVDQQHDSQITVLPRVSAALPIIGVITGGAGAGIGALIAGGLLKAVGIDLDRIGLRQYELTGPWAEPAFKSVPVDAIEK